MGVFCMLSSVFLISEFCIDCNLVNCVLEWPSPGRASIVYYTYRKQICCLYTKISVSMTFSNVVLYYFNTIHYYMSIVISSFLRGEYLEFLPSSTFF